MASFTPNNDNDRESDNDSQESGDSIQPPLQRRRVDQTPVTPSIGRKKSQPIQLLPPSMTTISSPTTTYIVQQPTQTSAPSVTTIISPTTKIQTRQQQSQPVHVPPSVTIRNSSSTTKHTHGNIHRKRQRVISTCISTTSTPEWTSTMNCTTNSYPTFTSTSPVGPTVLLPLDSPPIDFFHQVFQSQLLDHLCEQTNIYAQQKNVRDWVDTTPQEMNAFIGFVLGTAIHRLPRLDNYWSSHWVLRVPDFAKIFTRKRFWQLWSNLHLNDNTKAPSRDEPNYDKLFKIRPMLDMLQHSFRNAHHPSQQVSVDEAMVRFKGRSSLKQYMPMKPIKRGFKIWCCSDANSGYLQEFQIYTGKEAALQNSEIGLTHAVVKHLLDPLAGKYVITKM